LYDALITWDLIGHIDVTPVSLKFWQQFDRAISVQHYKKGSPDYKVLIEYVRDWANKIVLQLEKATPSDYVLVMCVEKETGGPYGPRGMIRSLAAALGVIDAHKGLVPPNWGHPIPGSSVSNELPAQPQRAAQTDSYRHSPDIYLHQGNNLDGFRYKRRGY
jgi:glucoamylase